MECACHVGALLAEVSQELIDLYVLFGHNLGMASQIANDLQGIIDGRDIANKKVTLPVIYALAHTQGNAHRQLELAFTNSHKPLDNINQTREILFASGAIYYTTILMELYKQYAEDALANLDKAGMYVERLKSYLE